MKRKRKVWNKGINDLPGRSGTQYYRVWVGMLERCYSKEWQSRFPTYRGCTVSDPWLVFSNFKAWMETQDWEGKQLDKDILGDGKLYSPETCCFVEGWLNLLFTDHGAARGKYPIGVSKHASGRFQARIRIDGEQITAGYFDSPTAAHGAYLVAKREYVEDKMKGYPDQKVRRAVLSKNLTAP